MPLIFTWMSPLTVLMAATPGDAPVIVNPAGKSVAVIMTELMFAFPPLVGSRS